MLDGYEVIINHEGSTVFQQIVYGNRRFMDCLLLLDDVFSVYPPGFFSRFRWTEDYGGVLFLLVDDIKLDGISIGGVQTGADSDGRIIIWLSREGVKERGLHHEIGHAIDYRVRWEYPDAFTKWDTYNPEGFTYSRDISVVTDKDKGEAKRDDWFVRGYSEIDEFEDRATVFEAIMTKDNNWWSTRPHLQEKADFLLKKVSFVFGELLVGE